MLLTKREPRRRGTTYLLKKRLNKQSRVATRRVRIRSGLEGTDDTVEEIRKLIVEGSESPACCERVEQVLRGVAPQHEEGKVRALFHFCRKQIRYRREKKETLQSVDVLLQGRPRGDCDDQVVLLGAMLRCAGFQRIVLVVVGMHNDHEYDHIYLKVQLKDGKWKALDLTKRGRPPGWETGKAKIKKMYNV